MDFKQIWFGGFIFKNFCFSLGAVFETHHYILMILILSNAILLL